MKIVSLSIQVATLILISCISVFAGQQEQSWEYKDWQVETHDDFVRCVTHGQVVHGHEFGIVKMKGNCNQSLLYISWSASDKRLAEHKGKDAVLRLQIDDIKRQVTIPLLYARELYPGLTVGTFTNIAVGEEFIALLKKGHKLEVTVHGPDELVRALDITSDTFSLDGVTASMLKAQEFCEATVKQRKASIYAQQHQTGNEASRITVTNIDPEEDKSVHSRFTTEPTSRQNPISNHKEKTSNETGFPITLAIIVLFFISSFLIILFIKSMIEGRQAVEAYRVANKEYDKQKTTIDFKHSDEEKDLIDELESTLSTKQSFSHQIPTFFKQSSCMAGVINTLHSCGMTKQDARSLVDENPLFFKAILDMTKNVTNQQRNLIAAFSFLQLVGNEDHRVPMLLYMEVAEAIKYQLKVSKDWKEIGRTFATVLHLMNKEEMMSDEEIEETFNPVNIEFKNINY